MEFPEGARGWGPTSPGTTWWHGACYAVIDLVHVIEESQTWWVKTTSPGEIRI
ncbi:hypothetical protein GCM10018783_02980 [Streptomyces griseosporeus]|nr:hypothetical protein GCM10018783_02980 [Streptomyces griseosporeus]